MPTKRETPSKRLFSLDVFRGTIMFLLIAEAAGFHESFAKLADSTSFSALALQLQHHPWNGLRFWDLIQPFFMFIVGVAMPFSLKKRLRTGSRRAATKHMLRRCFLLFSFGVLLHCIYAHGPVWELWNVLVQLAFTILIAYAIMNRSPWFQIAVSVGLLILTELLYRGYNPAAPYGQHHESFGAWFDMLTMGKTNEGYWVFINFLPTAAHTIWGLVCGQRLLSKNSEKENLKFFLIWGTAITALGYGMDVLNITPIIKRIATTSFTLVSGGISILTLALFYWAIDVKGYRRKWLTIFSVVGTNSIFIYLFSETFGHLLFREFDILLSFGVFDVLQPYKNWMLLVEALLILFFLWWLTYYLDKRKLYFKV
ncbi:acyltransferase family protein [Maribacter chungangensis]|uniref:Acyltransferase family protein n=1 Tax=Maribacter chungangensis TaxID=1069117 RepID=A0ABW3B949_9FLAO